MYRSVLLITNYFILTILFRYRSGHGFKFCTGLNFFPRPYFHHCLSIVLYREDLIHIHNYSVVLSMSTASDKGLVQIGRHDTKKDKFELFNNTNVWKGKVKYNI